MKLQEVKDAINQFFNDVSRSKQATLDGLEEIEEQVGDLICALEDDMENE